MFAALMQYVQIAGSDSAATLPSSSSPVTNVCRVLVCAKPCVGKHHGMSQQTGCICTSKEKGRASLPHTPIKIALDFSLRSVVGANKESKSSLGTDSLRDASILPPGRLHHHHHIAPMRPSTRAFNVLVSFCGGAPVVGLAGAGKKGTPTRRTDGRGQAVLLLHRSSFTPFIHSMQLGHAKVDPPHKEFQGLV
jgi:hypothetical protein